jgi:SHS2 domain-containing protein
MLFSRFEVEEFGPAFKAKLYGERFDPEKHEIKEQVKAATYHQISFQKSGDRWIIQAIFDV